MLILSSSCEKQEPKGNNLPKVYIKETDGKFELIRNGKPFYIKGGAAQAEYLEELKEAGGNTARIYDTTNLASTLDRAQELGLAVVVDIPLPKFDRSPQFFENKEKFQTI